MKNIKNSDFLRKNAKKSNFVKKQQMMCFVIVGFDNGIYEFIKNFLLFS